MNLNNQRIDWNAPDILMQIVSTIEAPLTSIIEANKIGVSQMQYKKDQNEVSEIIFSNSKEISDLIKEVVKVAKSRSVSLHDKTQPHIFAIYTNNPRAVSYTHLTLPTIYSV